MKPMILLMYPGQGSQMPGMGKVLFETSEAARQILQRCSDAVEIDLKSVMFGEHTELLHQTSYAQPALFAAGLMAHQALQEQLGLDLIQVVDYVIGHSLGEYTALCAAGSMTPEQGIQVVRERGFMMQTSAPPGTGGMAAILGLSAAQVRELLADTLSSPSSVCVLANDNSPAQVVISGTLEAVRTACQCAMQRGAKRTISLNVSGPFHSPLMEPAARQFQMTLEALPLVAPSRPIIMNTAARPIHDVSEIRSHLLEQMCGVVRFRESIEWCQAQGTIVGMELGSGTVLSNLAKRMAIHHTHAIQSIPDIDLVRHYFSG